MALSTQICEIMISGFEATRGDFQTSKGYRAQIELPAELQPAGIHKAQRDCEIIAKILQANSQEMLQLFTDFKTGNMRSAKERLDQLGLTEQDFDRQGGGLMWLVVIAVVLYATDVY